MKTFLEEVALDLKERLGKNLADSALIFVNKRPILYMQEFLSQNENMPIWSPAMFTIQDFFNLSTKETLADPYTQFFTLWKSYQGLTSFPAKDKMEVDRFYRMGLTILSDFMQLDEELIPVQQLYEDLRNMTLIDLEFGELNEEQISFLSQFWSSFSSEEYHEKQESFLRLWKILPKLYQNFHQGLKELSFITQGKIYRDLVENYAEKIDFLKPFESGKLVFIGFNALTKTERILFKKWQDQGLALFYFDGDPYYLDNPIQEAGQFLRRNLNQYGLQNALDFKKSLIQEEKKIEVISVQGQTAQAKLLPEMLNPILSELKNQAKSTKIALVLADESLLIPVLQSLPVHFPGEEERIPLNITMGYSLVYSTLFGLLESYLRIQEEISIHHKDYLDYSLIQSFFLHPFFPAGSNSKPEILSFFKGFHGPKINLDELENLSSIGLYIQKMETGSELLFGLSHFLESVLEQNSLKNLALEEEILLTVQKEILQFTDGILDFEKDLNLKFLISLIRRILKLTSCPIAGEPLEGLQIMGLMESRSLDFDHVYILGADEDHLPKGGIRDSLIPHSIRKAYGLSVGEDQEALIAYVFYRLFHRSKHVSILYNSNLEENNSGELSRFVRQLEFESGLPLKTHSYSSDFSQEPNLPVQILKHGKIWDRLLAYTSQVPNSSQAISATQLTSFIQCSLRFALHYLMGMKEPLDRGEEIDSRQFGEILHGALFQFYADLVRLDPSITENRLMDKKAEVKSIVQKAYEEIRFKNRSIPKKTIGKDRIVLSVLETYFLRILDHDLKLTPFTILALEEKDSLQSFISIPIEGKEMEIRIQGIIDRLDEKSGNWRIVDYKTGKDLWKIEDLDTAFNQIQKPGHKAFIQTLFYTYLAKKIKNRYYIEPHLYIPGKMNPELNLGIQDTLFEFKKGKNKIQGDILMETMIEFEEKLKQSLVKIFDRTIPFQQTDNLENCKYCEFKVICNR